MQKVIAENHADLGLQKSFKSVSQNLERFLITGTLVLNFVQLILHVTSEEELEQYLLGKKMKPCQEGSSWIDIQSTSLE